MMYWDNAHMGLGWGAAMTLVMLAFWGLIAFAIVSFVRARRTSSASPAVTPPARTTASPEQILAERLAHGEIDAEDYHARLRALTPSR